MLGIGIFIGSMQNRVVRIYQRLNILSHGVSVGLETDDSRISFFTEPPKGQFKGMVDGECVGISGAFHTV